MKPEEIKDFISNAFAPYKCETALFDFNHHLNFRILDKDNKPIFTYNDLHITGMNRQDVQEIIDQCKAKLNNIV